MDEIREICKFCKSSVKDKYTLKNHLLRNKKCLKIRGLSLTTNFICKGCEHICTSNINLSVHIETCKEYIIMKVREDYQTEVNQLKNNEKFLVDTIIKLEKIQKDNDKILNDVKDKLDNALSEKFLSDKALFDKENQLQTLQSFSDKALSDAQSQIDKLQKMLENIATKAVDKPTTNTTFNQIRNNYSSKYFLENIKAEEVKKKCQTNFTEEILMNGQRGIARLCTDQIINTKDKKKLLVATDQSRNKFRYMDEKGNMKDDIEARTFIEKVSKPIKEVAGIVFDNVLLCITPLEI